MCDHRVVNHVIHLSQIMPAPTTGPWCPYLFDSSGARSPPGSPARPSSLHPSQRRQLPPPTETPARARPLTLSAPRLMLGSTRHIYPQIMPVQMTGPQRPYLFNSSGARNPLGTPAQPSCPQPPPPETPVRLRPPAPSAPCLTLGMSQTYLRSYRSTQQVQVVLDCSMHQGLRVP